MKRTIRNLFFLVLALVSIHCSKEFDCGTDHPNTIPDEAPAPTYVYPPDNSAGQSRTPVLVWNAYRHAETGVHHYLLYLNKGYGEDDKILDGVVVPYDTFYVLTDTLEMDTEHEWAVWVFDQYDDYEIGPEWHFTTGSGFNNPPATPFDPDPEDGSSSNALFATLNWDCFDPDGDPIMYDVWIDTWDTDSTLIASGISVKTADPGGLDPDRLYSWKVVAFDSEGDTTAGPWWVFKTRTASNRPPVEPFGPYPPDDATHVPLDVTLGWSCSDPDGDPISYDVAMGLAGGNLYNIVSDLTESSFDVVDLDPLTEYEWQVSATDDHSQTTPGPIWSFTSGDGSSGDVFAALELGRSVTYDGSVVRVDHIFARFDSLYAPVDPINPLQPSAVSCNTFDLVWSEGMGRYAYTDYVAGYFLDPGTTYSFTVSEGDGVPPLSTDPITFPVCQPYITSPAPFSTVSMNGFDLEWHTFCSGMIDITIMDLNGDSTGVYIRTEDDGSYSFTAGDLSIIDPSAYQLQIVLINENGQYITAPGYDSRSYVRARVLSPVIVYRE